MSLIWFSTMAPTERFGGEEHQNGHIKGTIKLKNARWGGMKITEITQRLSIFTEAMRAL